MSQQHHVLSALGGCLLLGLAACQVSSGAAPAATPAAPTPTAGPTPTGAPTMDAPPAPAPRAATPSAATPSAAASAPAPAAAASPPALVLAPPPGGAPADEREKLVLRLLQTPDASKLGERASDGDLEQEPDREAHILSRMRPEPGMVHTLKVRMGDFTVSAGLPNEIVKRIFRQNLGRVRLCYEKQLEKKP